SAFQPTGKYNDSIFFLPTKANPNPIKRDFLLQCACSLTSHALATGSIWDNELNKHYEKLMAGLDAAGKANLKDSQRAWIVYRDREIHNIVEYYAKVEGTMFRTISAAARTNLTKNRALSLSYMADFVEIREK
ncbi:MAG: hypothetical protein CBC46_04610, partial [Verrucomicrobiaceae bacterium TMED86]